MKSVDGLGRVSGWTIFGMASGDSWYQAGWKSKQRRITKERVDDVSS
jgi:hypothetical protein